MIKSTFAEVLFFTLHFPCVTIATDVDGASYALWIWKGSYLNLGSGAKYGLYTGEIYDVFFWDVALQRVVVDYELPMTLNLYNMDIHCG
ncbi:MAG: hypothetical protein R3Y54_12885 [Eubacteriales bacterium]